MNLDLVSKRTVKNLLKEKAIHPSKRMGQHFLVRRAVLHKIIESSELKTEDVVLEIGAGLGTLTVELARRVKKVIAIEKDSRMVKILKENLNDFKNIEILPEDILKIHNSRFINYDSYKIVANLPYSIATEVIRKFLEPPRPPKLMVLMLQKEVGRRICSKPPKMTRLGVLVQTQANVKILGIVKKESFWPPPKVDSVILKIIPHKIPVNISARLPLFVRIVRAGFSHPRKQLINNFSETLGLPREKIKSWLSQNTVRPTQRAESLNLNDWLNLTKSWDRELET